MEQLRFIVPPTGCNQSCAKCQTTGTRAAAHWLRQPQTNTSTQSYGWICVLAPRQTLRYRGWWADRVAALRDCLDFTMLWLDGLFHDWLTDWLQRLPVDWKPGAVNMKVHLRWGSRTQKLLVFVCQTCLPSPEGHWLQPEQTSLKRTGKVLECAAYKPGASLQKYDPTACPIFKDRKNPIVLLQKQFLNSCLKNRIPRLVFLSSLYSFLSKLLKTCRLTLKVFVS